MAEKILLQVDIGGLKLKKSFAALKRNLLKFMRIMTVHEWN